jgi:excisionase family DNA binding protein
MDNQQYVSLAQAAKILGISRIAVYKKVKKNQLPAMRIGRSFVVERRNIKNDSVKSSVSYDVVINQLRACSVLQQTDIMRKAIWDYNISVGDAMKIAAGEKKTFSINQQGLLARILTTLPWTTLMEIFKKEGVTQLLQEEVVSKVWPVVLREKFDRVREVINGR